MAYNEDLFDAQGRVIRSIVSNTAKDGSGTPYFPLVDSDGHTQADVVAALPAGTNAIGKLAANSGVDIGDVDVLSIAAGNNRIGTVSGVLKEVRVTKNILIGGAYSANDVVSESLTNGTGTDWDFTAVARANGGYGYIVGATIVSQTPNITPRLSLLLFNAAPTGELDDNAANSSPVDGDLAKYIGVIDFPSLNPVGTSANSSAVASPSTVGNLPLVFKCAAAADDLFGILVTRDAFTQVAADNMTIILTVEQY